MNTEILNTDDLAFLAALQSQLVGEETDRRGAERYDLAMQIEVSPADTSRAREAVLHGETMDVAYSGIRAQLPAPPQVGDHYRVKLQPKNGQAARSVTAIARCVRCALIEDNLFEAAFSFLAPITSDDLPLDSL